MKADLLSFQILPINPKKKQKKKKKNVTSDPAKPANECRMPVLIFFFFFLYFVECRGRWNVFFFSFSRGNENCLNADDVITLKLLHQQVLCFYNDMEMGLEDWQAVV